MTTNSQVIISNQDPNPAYTYVQSLGSERSRNAQADALDLIASIVLDQDKSKGLCFDFPWHKLDYAHTMEIRSILADKYSHATVNRHLSALRMVLKSCRRLGLMSYEAAANAADIPSVKGKSLPPGRALDLGEIGALIRACQADTSAAGVRDAALIAAMYPGGLRRAEVVALDLKDYLKNTGQLKVHSGKGNKSRLTFLSNGASRAMDDWIEIRGDEPGPLFYSINKGGVINATKRISLQVPYDVCSKRAAEAGVERFSPHDLRRTTATLLFKTGCQGSVIQDLLGHASIVTTSQYNRICDEDIKEASTMLSFPYVSRLQ